MKTPLLIFAALALGAGCLDPGDPGNLVPRTVMEDPTLPQIQVNGTLRIYHGYPGHNDKHCCNVAAQEHKKAQAAFDSGDWSAKADLLLAYFEQEFTHRTSEERLALLNDVLDTLYSYDPGFGSNRPGKGN